MKKLVFAFAAIVAVSFASCTGTTQNTQVCDSDTVAVEEVVEVDTTAADTTAADTTVVAE